MTYDRTNTQQRDALIAEIQKPAYAADVQAGNDQAVASSLNKPAGLTVRRGIRSSLEVMGAIVASEFAALTAGARDYFMALVSAGQVDLSNDNVRTALQTGFPAGTATRTNLAALADKATGSRAEEMFGIGTVISAADISNALRG